MRVFSYSATPGVAGLLAGASRVALLAVALVGASTVAALAGDPAKGADTSAPSVADPMAMESLLDQSNADIDLTAVDPADWAPDHAQHAAAGIAPSAADKSAPPKPDGRTRDAKLQEARPPEPVPQDAKERDVKPQDAKPQDVKLKDAKLKDAKGPGKEQPAKSAGKSDSDVDPEPDGVVVPSTGASSNDPLDRPRPSKDAAKDATKSTPPQPASPKADAAKTLDPKAADPKATVAAPVVLPPDASKPAADAAAQMAEPLPPLNAAIKASLDKRAAEPIKGAGAAEKRKEREAVSFFYAAHGFAPAWSEHDKPIAAVAPVLDRLAKAGEDALSVPDVPTALKTDGSAEDKAASDIALTEAVVAYARQASGSRIDPRSISVLIGAKPQLVDPAEVLDGLVAAGPEAGSKLAALNPSDRRYLGLREKLAEIRGQREPRRDTDEARIPDGPLLKIGMRDARVAQLRSRLDVPANGDGDDADLYDADLADAVKAFQRKHGIQPLGMVGGRTLTALNGGAAPASPKISPKLEGTIAANMEMWRWMPHEMGRERIEVNVPDYQVVVFHDNEPVAKNRVVVGKTDSPTPIFSNTMKYLIVNPVWNVPQSIIKNEFGGGTHGFKARYVHGQLFLQQPAGPKNALGRIKFMFPNDFSVYLHDTPAKALFSASKRAYSHGCVRVDKPFEFAESVLNDAVPEGGKILWSQARLEKMLGNTERYVNLPTPLPIHIEYFTASVENGGRVNLREDVYGYTGAVAAALGYGKSSIPVATYKPSTPSVDRKHRYAREDDGYPRRRSRRRDAEYVQAPPAQPSFFMPW